MVAQIILVARHHVNLVALFVLIVTFASRVLHVRMVINYRLNGTYLQTAGVIHNNSHRSTHSYMNHQNRAEKKTAGIPCCLLNIFGPEVQKKSQHSVVFLKHI